MFSLSVWNGTFDYAHLVYPELASGGACPLVQQSRIRLPMQEMQVPSLGGENPLDKEMATHSSILAQKSHGQRSLVGYTVREVPQELDLTEHIHTHSLA